MCGIAGKLVFEPDARVERSEIDLMLAPIGHRGPDSQGVYLDRNVGLGHARLSIIDVGGGGQPMANEDDSVWIVFNGEIYNFQPLREQLIARGHKFKTHSDTEVIIHLYEEHGPDCVKFMRGMFAFAIWDERRRRLFVARDRVGIKPLYYCQTPDALYFGSELKSIIADPAVSRDLNEPAIRQFLSFYYSTGPDTLFDSVKKLPPGHYFVAENGKVTITKFWDLKFTRDRWSRSFDDVVAELYELLGSTVRDHMIADVPVGVLLSGGVDSSAMLSFAVRETGKQVKTFTVGFDGDGIIDERPYARMAAQKFGSEHFELSVTSDDFWKFLPAYVWHMEDPVCEPPAMALYYVSKLAREHVKVLLSGEGGDEAFAGYPNYASMLKVERIEAMAGPLSRPAGAGTALVGRLLGEPRLQRYGEAFGRSLSDHYFSRLSGPATFFNRRAGGFFSKDFLSATGAVSPAGLIAALTGNVANEPLLNQMLYVDSKTWLPDDLLIKADKITMANSLELRVPLLDHEVLEFAASLPPEYKIKGKESKRALKAALSKVLPQEILTRKKAGFPVPYAKWLQQDFSGRVRDVLLSERAVKRGHFQKGALERLLTANERDGCYAKEVFCLTVLEMWHQQFADQAKPAVFKARALDLPAAAAA